MISSLESGTESSTLRRAILMSGNWSLIQTMLTCFKLTFTLSCFSWKSFMAHSHKHTLKHLIWWTKVKELRGMFHRWAQRAHQSPQNPHNLCRSQICRFYEDKFSLAKTKLFGIMLLVQEKGNRNGNTLWLVWMCSHIPWISLFFLVRHSWVFWIWVAYLLLAFHVHAVERGNHGYVCRWGYGMRHLWLWECAGYLF